MIYHTKQVSGSSHPANDIPGSPQSHGSASDPLMGLFGRPKVLWIGGVGMVMVIASLATWYYVDQARKHIPLVVQEDISEEDVDLVPQLPPPEDQPSATTTLSGEEQDDVVPTSTLTTETRMSFPRIFLIDSVDTDADELTDQEEQLLGTNQDMWDTDEDGYYDGQEVVNLYSPRGFAPMRLIDSGLFSEYLNPVWKYRVYYPVNWQVGTVDTESRQVLFSTISGDFMEVRVFEKSATQGFQDWFADTIEGQRFQDLQMGTNRFGETVYRRSDGLVGYVIGPSSVTVLLYHPGVEDTVSYRSIMRVMLESFRQETNTATLPVQTPLPPAPSSAASTSSLESGTVSDS